MTIASSKSRRKLALGVAALSGAAVLAAAPGAVAQSSATTFADRSGDAAAAIDVTAVSIATDAQEIVFTQRLRNVNAPAPLFAFAPEYGFGFLTRDALGRPINGVVTTVIGNSGETRLDVYDMAARATPTSGRGPSIPPRAR